MSEQLVSSIERLDFSEVKPGDIIHIKTGVGDETWQYDFAVENASRSWPRGSLKATTPDGNEVGPVEFALHGCGQWTNRMQNSVQKQDRAFTPYYEGLIIGQFLMGKSPEQSDRLVFDNRGQEISEITVTITAESARS